MSEFVCPECNAFLGISGVHAKQCPKCEAPIVVKRQRLDEKAVREVMGFDESEPISNGQRDIWIGAIWFIAGFVLTIVSYIAAVQRGGGVYYIVYGPVIAGGIQFLRGLQAWDRKRSAYEELRRLNPDIVLDDDDDVPVLSNRRTRHQRKRSAPEPILELTKADANEHAVGAMQS